MNIIDEVIPAGSLGGFQIREELNVYSENLIEFYNQGQLSYEQTGIWSVRYSFETHPVEVSVDIRSGLVFKISALAGYKGK